MNVHQANPVEASSWDATELLRGETFGRLCVIDHGTPLAIPVNYRLLARDGTQQIVVRTASTGVLSRYEGPASFEVDRVDVDQGRAWSVIARGRLRRGWGDAMLPDPEPWVAGNRSLWLVLEVDVLSARRFTAAPGAGGFEVEWTTEADA